MNNEAPTARRPRNPQTFLSRLIVEEFVRTPNRDGMSDAERVAVAADSIRREGADAIAEADEATKDGLTHLTKSAAYRGASRVRARVAGLRRVRALRVALELPEYNAAS